MNCLCTDLRGGGGGGGGDGGRYEILFTWSDTGESIQNCFSFFSLFVVLFVCSCIWYSLKCLGT